MLLTQQSQVRFPIFFTGKIRLINGTDERIVDRGLKMLIEPI